MKKTNAATLVIFFLLLFRGSFAQKELYGEWKVSCPMEKMDAASFKSCNLCPSVEADKSITFQDFEMTIDKDEIKLNRSNVITPVKYKWNDNTYSISFDYNSNNYFFKLILTGTKSRLILKNKDGVLLLLDKK